MIIDMAKLEDFRKQWKDRIGYDLREMKYLLDTLKTPVHETGDAELAKHMYDLESTCGRLIQGCSAAMETGIGALTSELAEEIRSNFRILWLIISEMTRISSGYPETLRIIHMLHLELCSAANAVSFRLFVNGAAKELECEEP